MNKPKVRPQTGELAGTLDAMVAWLDAHSIGIFWG